MFDGLRWRPMTHVDLTAYQAWFTDPVTAHTTAYPAPQWQDYYLHQSSPQAQAWIARLHNQPVAGLLTERQPDNSVAISIVVAPGQRKRGIGYHALMRFLVAHLPETIITAMISPENHASRRLFAKAGFQLKNPHPDSDNMLTYQRYFTP